MAEGDGLRKWHSRNARAEAQRPQRLRREGPRATRISRSYSLAGIGTDERRDSRLTAEGITINVFVGREHALKIAELGGALTGSLT